MNHAEAISSHAAEKYLLGELSGQEAEGFELHFFACEECAADVESGTILIENVRALGAEKRLAERVPQTTPKAPAESRWKQFLAGIWARPLAATPAFAALAFAALAGYQGLVTVPALRQQLARIAQGQQLPSFVLMGASRGEGNRVAVPSGAGFFALTFDPVWTPSFARYRCDVLDAGGAVRTSIQANAPAAGQPISLLLGKSDHPAGSYVLLVKGIAADNSTVDVARYTFTVE